MREDSRVEFYARSVQRDAVGQIIYHPLAGLYRVSGDSRYSHGDLALAGNNLDQSDYLDDVREYRLEFYGESSEYLDREAWADSLRGDVLYNLSQTTGSRWYVAFKGDMPDPKSATGFHSLDEDVMTNYISRYHLQHAVVHADPDSLLGRGNFGRRLFVEYPPSLIAEVIERYLHRVYPAAPFEGCLMASGQINRLVDWNAQPRTDLLFREVIDTVDMLFYTVPAEHRHFIFLTSKYAPDEMARMISLDMLQEGVRRLLNQPENKQSTGSDRT